MLFGKLPVRGDFLSRGMEAGAREALDGWLSGALADARDVLGTDFETRFDLAPPWRFVRREADGWVAGALAPSADSAGRRFPLMLARGGLDEGQAEAVAGALEEVLYAAVGNGWGADDAFAACDAVEVKVEDGPAATADRWWTLGGGDGGGIVFPPAELAGAWPEGLFRHMLSTSGTMA